ncbi:MAG TPA: FAD-binding protein, partial [Flavisolibacter sp.]|nr:FAD-binding protein [Flavisolibacter sp.]
MQIRENFSLRPYNTFGIAATARYFTSFQSTDELKECFDPATNIPDTRLILGGGSNILLTKDFDGIVLKNEIGGIAIVGEDEEHIYVKAGAGVNWHQLVMFCVDNGFAGMENLSLIPGNVGASPMQNIGAYGVEIKDIFHQLEAFHINEQCVKPFSLDECEFGYRESVFKRKYKGEYVITSVTYRLTKKPVFHT